MHKIVIEMTRIVLFLFSIVMLCTYVLIAVSVSQRSVYDTIRQETLQAVIKQMHLKEGLTQ